MREKVKRDRERCREDKGERIEWYIETEIFREDKMERKR